MFVIETSRYMNEKYFEQNLSHDDSYNFYIIFCYIQIS